MPGSRSVKHNTMFVKLLLSLTAIAVITVVLIATVTYSISADNSIQNSIEYNESILAQQQQLIHKELTAIQNAAIGMIMTQSYLYHTRNGKLTVSSLIDLSDFVEEQKKISPYIDSIYLYYDPLELVLTSRPEVKTSPVSTFADSSWLDVWKQKTESRTVWVTGRPNGFVPDRPAASLLQKMPLIGQVQGAIVINLNLDKLFGDYLSHYHNKKGATLVLGPSSERLYSEAAAEESLPQQVDLKRLQAGSGSYIDASDRIVSYTTSELTGWRFVDITERSVLLEGMGRIKVIVLTVAVTYMAAAFAISFYLSRRLYRPLQSVISYIGATEAGRRDEAGGTPPAGDEAGFIRHMFEQLVRNWETLVTEKRKVDSLLTDNRTAIKEKYMNDLIQGGGGFAPNGETEQAAELLGLRLDFARFAVLTLELEEPYPLKGPDGIFHFHLFRYGLMEELGADIDGEIFAKDDKRTVILLSVPPDEDEFPLEQAKKLKQHVLARYGMSVTIAVSRIYAGEQSVRVAFEDTIEALNLKIYIGKGEILPYSILNDWKAEEEAYYYPYELETKLQQALLQADGEECAGTLRQLTRTVIDKKLSKANIQQLYFQLSGEIVKTLVQTRGDMSAVFGDRPAYADALARAETLPDMEACLLDMCGRIVAFHKEKRTRMTDVTLQLATDYMDANFNKNISVDTVAEHVQRSSSYLSRIFKESTGMTVGDYLIQLRIRRAMELLTQPGLSIEEICADIGYANVSYFNKIFKARTGLTPGQYRQQQAADKLLAQGREQA
ncbi:helix-turn-helix domain-containing protein [Paenibacillus sp. N4]|uniref:helix-turn-helix domain-containing protein n=1 Tax=Paenibacillus vietnamensis TaxID=2590547 RepID=UPI001CD070A9|nr:helix-turn-helix domain-containing protein [Paenibacillus vietnamensis]MCA0753535.1 helix-turn-helix domain-containing protein [Paenibacillus vietnamensis]